MFAGLGAARIRKLFEEARKNAPSIVFIDELDAVGTKRMGGGFNREHDQTLNQLLVELDGFGDRDQVDRHGRVEPAAGPRPGAAAPRPLRPAGERAAPDLTGREAILRVHTRNKPLAADVDLSLVARQTAGLTGADLANICNEAAIFAGRKKLQYIRQADFDAAMERVIAGLQQRRVVTEKEKRILAYHEAGHALMAHLMGDLLPVQKVTIVGRGDSLGYAYYLPMEERYLHTKEEFVDVMKVALGRPRRRGARLRPRHERRLERPREGDARSRAPWCSSTACPRWRPRGRCGPTTTRSPRRRSGCATASRRGSPTTRTRRRSGCWRSTAPSSTGSRTRCSRRRRSSATSSGAVRGRPAGVARGRDRRHRAGASGHRRVTRRQPWTCPAPPAPGHPEPTTRCEPNEIDRTRGARFVPEACRSIPSRTPAPTRAPVASIASVVASGIHHVGVAVDDLDDALATYERLFGATLEHRASVPDQGVEAAAVLVGRGRVELLAPTGDDTPVGRFLASRGPGMHHVAYEVADVGDALARPRHAGAQLIDEAPRSGLFGLEVAFVHPDAVHGVLSEVVSVG